MRSESARAGSFRLPPASCQNRVFDLLVIGGGVNGAGVARDAAGRGLSVLLSEQGDLAQATSSGSTKLIHGGLRYLEYYAFGLVHKALKERDILLSIAPHIIWPLDFVLPYRPGLRPRWMLGAGLWLYDHLRDRRSPLPYSMPLNVLGDPALALLQDDVRGGYRYTDCWVQDARLVVLNAVDAARHGAVIRTHTRCVAAVRQDGIWRVTLRAADGGEEEVAARMLVNAAGPWVAEVLAQCLGWSPLPAIRCVKGSHIVIPRLFGHDRAYLLPQADGRVVFAIPYEQDFSLIGTTEEEETGDPLAAKITPEETVYLCAAVNGYFRQQITPEQVVWNYAAVRPLLADGAREARAVTRDYRLELDAPPGQAPLLSVYGGKLTTYRLLAEEAMARLSPWMFGDRAAAAWTARAALPGGNLPEGGPAAYQAGLRQRYPWLSEALAIRYLRHYGARTEWLIGSARWPEELGRHLGGGLYEAEVTYLRDYEYAASAEDILWRRSKAGLHMSARTRDTAAKHIAAILAS